MLNIFSFINIIIVGFFIYNGQILIYYIILLLKSEILFNICYNICTNMTSFSSIFKIPSTFISNWTRNKISFFWFYMLYYLLIILHRLFNHCLHLFSIQGPANLKRFSRVFLNELFLQNFYLYVLIEWQ